MLKLLPLLVILFAYQDKEIVTQTVEYKDGEVVLQGFLAYAKDGAAKRPGVIVFHEWKGHGKYVQDRAVQLAKLGYVAFAADMYGKGVFAKDHEEAGKLVTPFFKDREILRKRAKAGLEILAKNPAVDPKKIAAMGYCFGGTTSLELARCGADVVAVASFHGNLTSAGDTKKITAKVMVFHGADDAFVNPAIPAFQEEMKKAEADWQFVSFGGAVHSFTVKEAGDDPSKGMAYNEKADLRSWQMMKDFFAEALK